jgi:hypothetical protein
VTGEADLAGCGTLPPPKRPASVMRSIGNSSPELRMAARNPVPTLTHRRVREAGRTHGRGNTTALAICLK